MNFTTTLALTLFLSAWLVACAEVADETTSMEPEEPDHSSIVKSDLFAVITLQGATCAEVIDYEIQNELDYIATCKTGDRYRIHVSPEGWVNVDTHPAE